MLSPHHKKRIDVIMKQAGKTINKGPLINDGDTLAVAVSGGKDSLTLLDILIRRIRHLPITYTVLPIFIRMKGVHDSWNSDKLAAFCRELTGSFTGIESSCDFTTGKDPCFICSWHRRKALFDYCRRQGVHTIAFGHTLDDRAETLLMNLLFQGNISSMPPSLSLFDGDLRIIRPLAELSEDTVREYASLLDLPVDKSICPRFSNTSRKKVRSILESLEQTHPHVRQSIVAAADNVKPEYL